MPRYRQSQSLPSNADKPTSSKRAVSPRKKGEAAQAERHSIRVLHSSPQVNELPTSHQAPSPPLLSGGSAGPATSLLDDSPLAPDALDVVVAMIQVRAQEKTAARNFIESLGINWDMDFLLTSQQLLIRVTGPSSSLARLKMGPPAWLIQTTHEAVPVALGAGH